MWQWHYQNTYVTHAAVAAAASITTKGLSSVNTSNSALDLSADGLVALQLKEQK